MTMKRVCCAVSLTLSVLLLVLHLSGVPGFAKCDGGSQWTFFLFGEIMFFAGVSIGN
jgi:hypothetical protein